MSAQILLGEWAKITKEKAIIIDTMSKILALRSPTSQKTEQFDRNSEPSAPDKSNPEKYHAKKQLYELQVHKDTEQKLFEVLTNLRNQLWKLTERKRDLVMKRRLLIENGKDLTISLEEIKRQEGFTQKKLANRQDIKKKLSTDQSKQYLKLLTAQYKEKCNQLQELKENYQQVERETQQGRQEEQIAKDQLLNLKKQFQAYQQNNNEKRERLTQMRSKLEGIERQILVNQDMTKKLMSLSLKNREQKQWHVSLKQLGNKIEKMETVNKVLTESHMKWIQAQMIYFEKIDKQREALMKIRRKKNSQ